MKKTGFLRSVAFLLILCVAVAVVMHCYSQPKYFNTRFINTFDEMPDNTVDGIVLGSSVIAHGWVSAVSWEKYGMAAFQFGTSVQPMGSIPGFIEYVEKNHDPKFIIIDVHSLRKQSLMTSVTPSKVQEAYLNIPDIASRYSMLMDLFDYAERMYDFYGEPEKEADKLDRTKASMYLPLLAFHNRWVDGLEKADFVDVKNEYLGANDRYTSFLSRDMTANVKNLDYGKTVEIDDFQKGEIDRLTDYLKQSDLEVLFINTPSFKSKAIQRELASILKYCADKGYNTIDFSTRAMLKEAGFDTKVDFSDNGHVNLAGAQKLTDYVCRYLIDNGYPYEDRRGQEGYDIWEKGLETYKDYYKKGWAGEDVKLED